MDNSILTTIKKLLGLPEEVEHYDMDIIVHINSTLFTLSQIGVGPTNGFSISDKDAVWSDFVSSEQNLEAIKSYIFIKVRILFDPPASSAALNALTEAAKEYEWRLQVATDPVGE